MARWAVRCTELLAFSALLSASRPPLSPHGIGMETHSGLMSELGSFPTSSIGRRSSRACSLRSRKQNASNDAYRTCNGGRDRTWNNEELFNYKCTARIVRGLASLNVDVDLVINSREWAFHRIPPQQVAKIMSTSSFAMAGVGEVA